MLRQTLKFTKRFYVSGKRPLEGIRVLDLSRVLAGPHCTQLLGDLGAEIIKIEKPKEGDDTRKWYPPLEKKSNLAAYFLCANRNKKSVTVNIKHEKGKEIIKRLARKCDVFVENFKVGELEKLGLGYNDIKKENEEIIYASITGYGQNGPKKDLPGYDFAIQARAGVMSITGPPEDEPNSKPYKVGVAISDVMTGMYTAVAILSSLIKKMNHGGGQYIDMSLFDVTLAYLVNQSANYLTTGQSPKRIGNSHPNIAPYDSFETANGPMVINIGNDKQFEILCKIIGADELLNEEKFKTNPNRVKNKKELNFLLNEKLKLKNREFWIQNLEKYKIPASPINTLKEAFEDDQSKARKMLWDIKLENGESVTTVANPIKFSQDPLENFEHSPPPKLGEHTEQVLMELLEVSKEQLEEWKKDGII